MPVLIAAHQSFRNIAALNLDAQSFGLPEEAFFHLRQFDGICGLTVAPDVFGNADMFQMLHNGRSQIRHVSPGIRTALLNQGDVFDKVLPGFNGGHQTDGTRADNNHAFVRHVNDLSQNKATVRGADLPSS